MNIKPRLIYLTFFLLIISSFHNLMAGIVEFSEKRQGEGITNVTTADANVFYVQDDLYREMYFNQNWPSYFENTSVSNRIKLFYQESGDYCYSEPWNMQVIVKCEGYDLRYVKDTQFSTCTLNIDYDPTDGYIDTDVCLFNGLFSQPHHMIKLTIESVNWPGSWSPSDPRKNDIILEASIEVNRNFFFFTYTPAEPPAHTVDATEGITEFHWEYTPGVEEYDLEWIFVSDEDIIGQSNPDWDAATRISTTNNYYKINNVFDKGKVFYRLRCASYVGDDFDVRREGKWSAKKYVTFNDFYEGGDLNWQYQASYTEQGNAKEVINFLDAASKSRQMVTLVNSDSTALISETIYDYEGRPVIQTLPAPNSSRDKMFKFYEQFSLNTDVTPANYGRIDFDHDTKFTGCTLSTPGIMNNVEGASNYYSDQNAKKTVGYEAVIPDGEGYPFSLTHYDLNGRVKRQGMPGAAHMIGNGHETNYFYANVSKDKLYRMFGNNVGTHSNYKLEAVQDPNGQLSLAYKDRAGRVIATSLIGQNPTNLDALDSYVSTAQETVEYLDEHNHEVSIGQGTGLLIDYDLFITSIGTCTLTYTLDPEAFTHLCSSTNHKCAYDLTIQVFDDCNIEVESLTLANLSDDTPSIGTPQTFTFSASKVGVYRIKKILTLNQDALDNAVDVFLAALPPGCGVNELDDLEDLYGMNNNPCDPPCSGDACFPEVDPMPTCSELLQTLKDDLSPGGQYFDNNPYPHDNTPNNGWLSTFMQDGYSNSTYWATIDFGAGIDTWQELRDDWSPSFHDITFGPSDEYRFVMFHPEYCMYDWLCVVNSASSDYDDDLLDLNYSQATSTPSGAGPYYIDPTAMAGLPCCSCNTSATVVGQPIIDNDPFFSTYSGLAADMKEYIWPQCTIYSPPASYSMPELPSLWESAGEMAGCTECNQHWSIFRKLYIQHKRNIMINNFATIYDPVTNCKALNSHAIYPMCDGTSIEAIMFDNIADDDCSSAFNNSDLGFVIRFPNDAGALGSYFSTYTEQEIADEIEDIAETMQGTMGCRTPASFEYEIPTSLPTCSTTDIVFSVYDGVSTSVNINAAIDCDDIDPYDTYNVAQAIVYAINSHISTPDYTATISSSAPWTVTIYADVDLGDDPNGYDVRCEYFNTSSPYYLGDLTGGADYNSGNCPELGHCFCIELDMQTDYFTTNQAAIEAETGETFTDIEDYLEYYFETRYSYSVTTTDFEVWFENCTTAGSPIVDEISDPELPDEINCAVIASPPCGEDYYVIAGWNAQQEYGSQLDEAVQAFINNYWASCFTDYEDIGDFEDLSVTYEDGEYHFTLYYYDQAGNLTQTVPPEAVTLLSSSDVTDAKCFANPNCTTITDPVFPIHDVANTASYTEMSSTYAYNTRNQVREQTTPDGGLTDFWYNDAGQLKLSQNAKQAENFGGSTPLRYSYTQHDTQGRIKETGQIHPSTSAPDPIYDRDVLNDPDFPENMTYGWTYRVNATTIYYDRDLYTQTQSYPTDIDNKFGTLGQENTWGRVATVEYNQYMSAPAYHSDRHMYHYSYDEHGNVKAVLDHIPELEIVNADYFKTTYKYDILSGNVKQVGNHKYLYDKDNRLKEVFTTRDGILWDRDAKYFYYLHGPLARVEIGDLKVQGIDYAYTINGWLKGVNQNSMDAEDDIGLDGVVDPTNDYLPSATNIHKLMGRDAFGFTLGYFNDGTHSDYTGINSDRDVGATTTDFTTDIVNGSKATDNPLDLYNGNIKQMDVGLPTFNKNSYHYTYDQLNRLTAMDVWTTSTNWAEATATTDYNTTYTYDANGNIKSLFRNAHSSNYLGMDNLSYHYISGKNQLDYVSDTETSSPYNDIKHNQTTGNYTYDLIGNLKGDVDEQIAEINWNIYNKVEYVSRISTSSDPDLRFNYDGMGHRYRKEIIPRTGSGTENVFSRFYTYYRHDAMGNVMAIYDLDYSDLGGGNYRADYTLSEVPIYGSSRLGMRDAESQFAGRTDFTATMINGELFGIEPYQYYAESAFLFGTERELGHKRYELTNHLGNVVATVDDRKITANCSGDIHFTANVLSVSDFYPFGMEIPGRQDNQDGYRYGFNGMEKDDELLNNSGNSYTAQYWQYDPRLGRRWNQDPVISPSESPYLVMHGSPVYFIDPDGDKPGPWLKKLWKKITGQPYSGGKVDAGTDPVADKPKLGQRIRWAITDAIRNVSITLGGGDYGHVHTRPRTFVTTTTNNFTEIYNNTTTSAPVTPNPNPRIPNPDSPSGFTDNFFSSTNKNGFLISDMIDMQGTPIHFRRLNLTFNAYDQSDNRSLKYGDTFSAHSDRYLNRTRSVFGDRDHRMLKFLISHPTQINIDVTNMVGSDWWGYSLRLRFATVRDYTTDPARLARRNKWYR